MNKLMLSGLLVVILILGVGLYLGQSRNLNAAGTLSVEEMGQIKAGCMKCYPIGTFPWWECFIGGVRCNINGQQCLSSGDAEWYCSYTAVGDLTTFIHEGEECVYCSTSGRGRSCVFSLSYCPGNTCSPGAAISCGQRTIGTCAGGGCGWTNPAGNCGYLSTCS